MALFSLDNWPLLFISAATIVAAVIDGWKLKVPNWLTFPLIFSGWILGLCHSCGWLDTTAFFGPIETESNLTVAPTCEWCLRFLQPGFFTQPDYSI